MPFVSPIFSTTNIIQTNQKIKINPNNLVLKYVMTNNRNNFTITYLLSINMPNPRNPSMPLQYNQVDLVSLKTAILGKFKNEDIKYLEIVNFDTSKVIIRFKHEDWIRDAMNGVNGIPRLSKFELEFKLKKNVPMFILFDGFLFMFNEFITIKIIEHVKKYNLVKSYFSKILNSLFKNKSSIMLEQMFNYEYNHQLNTFSIKLKDTYILLSVYGISKMINNVNKKDFEETAKKYINMTRYK